MEKGWASIATHVFGSGEEPHDEIHVMPVHILDISHDESTRTPYTCINENDEVLSYEGHIPSHGCSCSPTRRDSLDGIMWVHNLPN